MTQRRLCVICILLFLAIGGFSRCGSAADTPASTFAFICRDAEAGGYQAFPDMCRLHDGRLMCIFHASYHHLGLPRPHPRKGAPGNGRSVETLYRNLAFGGTCDATT